MTSKTLLPLLLLGSVSTQCVLRAEEPNQDIGPAHRRSNAESPWVPLRSVLTPNGDLDLSRFPPHIASSIRLALKPTSGNASAASARASSLTPLEECGGLAVTTSGGPTPERTLRELALGAKSILTGRIAAAEAGFLSGTPGSLLDVVVTDVSLSSALPADHVSVFYPFAHAFTGRYILCKADLRFTLRPQIGDILIVFVVNGALDPANSLFSPGPSQVFLESKGTLLPGTYLAKESLPSTAKALVQTVKDLRASEVRQ